MVLTQREAPSVFVTVLAWLFIVFAALGLLMSVAQNIMISFMPSFPEPSDANFLERNFRILFLVPLVLSLVMLGISIGLLKRREWARKSFIGFLSFSVLYLAASLLFMWLMGMDSPTVPQGASSDFQDTARQFESMRLTMFVVMTIFVVGFSGLFIWIIGKLMQPVVCDEFAN